MEIIHLILGKANPERMNGVNRVVHEMATVQTNQGYAVQVWGITANPVHDYPQRNFKTKLFKSYRNPFKLGIQLKTALYYKRKEIVVHIHGAFLPRFYSAACFLHKYSIPFIVTPHSSYNLVMMQKNALIKKIYFSLFERKMLQYAAQIHLLGKTEWEGLEKIYHNKKSIMLPYGFSLPNMVEAAVAKYPVFSVVYCGRLSMVSKGLDIMLQGFAKFYNKFPQTQLIVIGEGKEKKQMYEIAKELGIAEAVVFKGSLFGDEKVRVLKKCHVFAHPSRTDGIPATIIESASIGLPCVVSQATNTGDYISQYDAGFTMPVLDATNFCLGLEMMYKRIVSKKESGQLQHNAVHMIKEAFNWETILGKLDIIYKNAFDPNRLFLNQSEYTI